MDWIQRYSAKNAKSNLNALLSLVLLKKSWPKHGTKYEKKRINFWKQIKKKKKINKNKYAAHSFSVHTVFCSAKGKGKGKGIVTLSLLIVVRLFGLFLFSFNQKCSKGRWHKLSAAFVVILQCNLSQLCLQFKQTGST